MPEAGSIRFQEPSVPGLDKVARYFARSEEAAWFSNNGPCVQLLEQRLGEHLASSVVTVASGTSAISVALATLRRPGRRKVLMPSFTFAAMPCVVIAAGLQGVLVDIEPEGWHVDPGALAAALEKQSEDVAAIIVGSSFGIPPSERQSDAWSAAARSHGIPLIVDSAAGFGSRRPDGQPLGHQGTVEAFSFHATKPLAIGEGGALSTDDPELALALRRYANFGFDGNREMSPLPGTNAKMSEVQAAIGLAALEGFQAVLDKRRTLAARYAHLLRDRGWRLQEESGLSSWQFMAALAPSTTERRDAETRCQSAGIETRRYYTPVHRIDAFHDFVRESSLEVTEDVADRVLCFPVTNRMTSTEVDLVVQVATGA